VRKHVGGATKSVGIDVNIARDRSRDLSRSRLSLAVNCQRETIHLNHDV